jgi:hypothetical protein
MVLLSPSFHATRTAVAAAVSLLVARLFPSFTHAGTRKMAERPVATTSSHLLALLVFDARFGLRGVTPVNQIGFLDVHKGSPFAPFKMTTFRPKYHKSRR